MNFAYLVASPTSLVFGNTGGGGITLNLVITNMGNAGGIIYSVVSSDPQFSLVSSPAFPLNINAGASVTLQVKCVPTGAGGITGTLTVNSQAINTQLVVAMSATGVATSDYNLTSNPAQVNFGPVKVSTTSATISVTMTNSGAAGCTITAIAVDPSGIFVLSGKPALPHHMAPGDSITFNIAAAPVALGLVDEQLGSIFSVTGDAGAAGSVQLEALVNSVLLIPAYSLGGTDAVVMFGILGLKQGSGYALLQADGTDWNSEEPGYIMRQCDFAMPGQEKDVKRVSGRYEDLGQAQVECTLANTRSAGNLSDSGVISFGTTGDGRIRRGFFDVDLSGEIITIKISRPANGGPLSFVDYLAYVEPRGEVVENT